VTWQDELRRLDEELAAGRLSAEEYRSLRDGLLSAKGGAAGGQAPTPTQNGDTSGEGATERSPFPPPFKWDQDPSDHTRMMAPVPPESTQVMRPPGDSGEDAERTQVVPGRPEPRPPQGDGDRTQVVPGHPHGRVEQPVFPGYGAPMQPPAQMQPPGVGQAMAPWQAAPDNAPPWAGSDLPPTTMPPAWLRQGPEDFAAEPTGSTGRRVLSIIGVIVLLVGISVGAYFLFRPGAPGNNPTNPPATAANQTTTPPPPTTTTEPPGPPIADLPGKLRDTSSVMTFTDVENLQYLTADEVATYQAGGAADSKMGFSRDGDVEIIVLVIKQDDAASAKQVRDELGALQVSYGLAAVTSQPGVLAGGTDAAGAGPLRRAHYATDEFVVRIQVRGPAAALVNQTFTEVLGAQLDELPADA
jgi:hypothetical protein